MTEQAILAAFLIIEKELTRLHEDLVAGNGDDDTTQEQIGDLHSQIMAIVAKGSNVGA